MRDLLDLIIIFLFVFIVILFSALLLLACLLLTLLILLRLHGRLGLLRHGLLDLVFLLIIIFDLVLLDSSLPSSLQLLPDFLIYRRLLLQKSTSISVNPIINTIVRTS